MFVWNRHGEHGDAQDGDETDGEEDHGEVEVVHAADDPGALPVHGAGPGPVGKLGHHATGADHEAAGQPPEGTLTEGEPESPGARRRQDESSGSEAKPAQQGLQAPRRAVAAPRQHLPGLNKDPRGAHTLSSLSENSGDTANTGDTSKSDDEDTAQTQCPRPQSSLLR